MLLLLLLLLLLVVVVVVVVVVFDGLKLNLRYSERKSRVYTLKRNLSHVCILHAVNDF